MSFETILIVAVLFFFVAPILLGEGQAFGSNPDENDSNSEDDD